MGGNRKKSKKSPENREYLITYYCLNCRMEHYHFGTGITRCGHCRKRNLVILSQEKISLKAVDRIVEILNDKLMECLKEDYFKGEFDDEKYDSEEKVLKRLASGKRLKQRIRSEVLSQEELLKLLDPK